MAQLHPHLRATAAAYTGPSGKLGQVAIRIQQGGSGAAERMALDHHAAGDDQPRATLRPALIQPNLPATRCVIGIGQCAVHGGPGNPVVQGGAIRQQQGLKQ